ncbi:response regulator [Novosphingobium sp. KCTC 2891]|uniref:response regulator n=1 Tax=Novosphingobium sp. KCTC 2891 TaxID=2989730 RepID=UPI002222055C|nr:response regulator [Novosphingobium sp. KCTC 2891]MCW1381583.1 response regulator [Novosphingobium sp. KCTC 2891]
MSAPSRILIVEDEAPIRALLRAALESAGHVVSEAVDAGGALAALHAEAPALVLLDLGLPDRDGLELVPLLRGAGAAVIVVSARDATRQKVAALDLGADDYVVKPFDAEEVLARVRTALRRRAAPTAASPVVRFGDVAVDLVTRQVTRADAEVHLAPKEYALLAELAAHAGKVLTHAHLLRSIWGPGHEGDVEYLRVAARGIRRKLEQGGRGKPSALRSEPGIGYRLVTS